MEPSSRNGNSPPPPAPANRGLAPIKLSVVDILVKWTKVIGSQKTGVVVAFFNQC